jgi:hypothetical protein
MLDFDSSHDKLAQTDPFRFGLLFFGGKDLPY